MASSAQSGLLALAKQLQDESGKLVSLIETSNVEEPSLRPSCTTDLWQEPAPELEKSRNRMVSLSRLIAQIADGPERYLWEFVGGAHYSNAALAVLLGFDIIQQIPLDGAASTPELARKSGLAEDKILRLLRVVACHHIVFEIEEKTFAHSAISARLLQDEATRALMEVQLDESGRASNCLLETLKARPMQMTSGEAAFKQAWGDEPFQWYGKHPEKASRFSMAMQGTTSGLGWNNNLISNWFKACPTTSDRNLVVDVGGGNGHVCFSLAEQYPNLTFLVQDLVQDMFRSALVNLPLSLQSRFRFQQHDFRQTQTLSRSDERNVKAFILRMVLWNWADDVAVQILRGLVPVLRQSPDIALLINDAVCCEPRGADPHIEKQLRHLDMVMMVLNNAKVRTEEEWRGLVMEADSGLKLVQIHTDVQRNFTAAVLEVRWTG